MTKPSRDINDIDNLWYREGYDAARRGESGRNCRYHENSAEASEWHRGYLEFCWQAEQWIAE